MPRAEAHKLFRNKPCRKCGGHWRYAASKDCVTCVTERHNRQKENDGLTPSRLIERWRDRKPRQFMPPKLAPGISLAMIMARR